MNFIRFGFVIFLCGWFYASIITFLKYFGGSDDCKGWRFCISSPTNNEIISAGLCACFLILWTANIVRRSVRASRIAKQEKLADDQYYASVSGTRSSPDSEKLEPQVYSDKQALLFVSEVLVVIRKIANTLEDDSRGKAIADLADSMHNIPRVIAEGKSEPLNFLIQGGVADGVNVWNRVSPDSKPTSVNT